MMTPTILQLDAIAIGFCVVVAFFKCKCRFGWNRKREKIYIFDNGIAAERRASLVEQ